MNKKIKGRNRALAAIIGLIWASMCFALLTVASYVCSIMIAYFPVGTVTAITMILAAIIALGYMSMQLYPHLKHLWHGEVKK